MLLGGESLFGCPYTNAQALLAGTEAMPRYAAYWVGYNIVLAYLQTNRLNESQLVGVDEDVLVRFASELL